MPADAEQRDARLTQIRTLLGRRVVKTQSQLVAMLEQRGHEVTQSSVSRDLTELGAIKVEGRYQLPDPAVGPADAVQRTVFGLVRGTTPAGDHLLVVRTPAGASAIICSALDKLELPEVVGTIAGDDTIFVATPSRAAQQRLVAILDALSTGGTP